MTPTRDDLRDGCRRDGAPLRAKLTYLCWLPCASVRLSLLNRRTDVQGSQHTAKLLHDARAALPRLDRPRPRPGLSPTDRAEG